ncbi:MAG: LPS export ABC transporter periplasmic protein LptC [Flavobacterium sp.]|nr:LPS export ABC transporter periplasmic protein LptC [Flavobacterium sp.]
MKIKKTNKYIFYFLLFALVFCSLISCESNFKEVQKINFSEFVPSGEADDFNLKYTDSGRIKSVLISPKMLDYAAIEYPFTQFPKGIDLTMFDASGKKTFVKSNYAISFKNTQVIDLQGNVTITNEVGQKMVTQQLYFDQKNEWFFTDQKYSFTSPTGSLNGEGVDFSKDFKIMNTQHLSGEVQTTK